LYCIVFVLAQAGARNTHLAHGPVCLAQQSRPVTVTQLHTGDFCRCRRKNGAIWRL